MGLMSGMYIRRASSSASLRPWTWRASRWSSGLAVVATAISLASSTDSLRGSGRPPGSLSGAGAGERDLSPLGGLERQLEILGRIELHAKRRAIPRLHVLAAEHVAQRRRQLRVGPGGNLWDLRQRSFPVEVRRFEFTICQ